MMRAAPILLSALLLVACGPETESVPGEKDGSGGSEPVRTPKVGNAPVTGSPVYRKDTEAIARDIEALEKQGRPTDGAKLAGFEREVRMKLNHIDVTLAALDVSIGAESKQVAEVKHASLLKKRQVIDKEIDGKWREITEIRELLKAADKGTDAIPAGFTKDELNVLHSDLEAEVRALREKRNELNTELQAVIDQLSAGGKMPEPGETTLTQEREILRELKKRAQKLLQS